VPRAVQKEVKALLKNGELFQSSGAGVTSTVALCEKDLAAYMGFKYCIAVNSHSSALFLALKAAGVGYGDKVLGSVLGSRAIPSAVHHVEAELVTVGSTRDLVIDVRDLAWKADKSGARYLVLSHSGGHVADLDDITRVCGERGIKVVEDCADSLGAWWDGRHIGHHGLACCISAGPDTLFSTGEGGFVATDDVVIAASVAAMAGSYDSTFRRRFAAPESTVFKDIDRGHFPNYSLAMQSIIAAVLRPEIASLSRRASEANRKYALLSGRFLAQAGGALGSSTQLHVPRPHAKACACLIGFRFGAYSGPKASSRFLAAAQARGVPLRMLATAGEDMPQTGTLPGQVYELSIPPRLSARYCELAADVLVAALMEATAGDNRTMGKEASIAEQLWAGPEVSSFDPVSMTSVHSTGNRVVLSRPEGPLAIKSLGARREVPRDVAGVRLALSAVPSLQSGADCTTQLGLRSHTRPSSRPASECGFVRSVALASTPPSHTTSHIPHASTGSVSFPLGPLVSRNAASRLPGTVASTSLQAGRVVTGSTLQHTAGTSSHMPGQALAPLSLPSSRIINGSASIPPAIRRAISTDGYAGFDSQEGSGIEMQSGRGAPSSVSLAAAFQTTGNHDLEATVQTRAANDEQAIADNDPLEKLRFGSGTMSSSLGRCPVLADTPHITSVGGAFDHRDVTALPTTSSDASTAAPFFKFPSVPESSAGQSSLEAQAGRFQDEPGPLLRSTSHASEQSRVPTQAAFPPSAIDRALRSAALGFPSVQESGRGQSGQEAQAGALQDEPRPALRSPGAAPEQAPRPDGELSGSGNWSPMASDAAARAAFARRFAASRTFKQGKPSEEDGAQSSSSEESSEAEDQGKASWWPWGAAPGK